MTKAESADRKARGAFFTPPEITRFLASWAIRSPADRILEPSCGEAAFLASAVRRLQELGTHRVGREQLTAWDIHEGSVRQAARRLHDLDADADLHTGDFFRQPATPSFQVVMGNPPFVRYQSFTGSVRARAAEAALAQGVRLDGLASSWAAFLVHSTGFLVPGGRLAMVLPAELLTVRYAAPVRSFVMRRFARVRLVVFRERIFPEVQEEVVLLLAEGGGPTDHCELHQVDTLQDVAALQLQASSDGADQEWTPAHAAAKWTAALVSPEAMAPYRHLTASDAFEELEAWGDTRLGMVSGNNGYFALSPSEAARWELEEETDLLPISPPGSRHLRNLAFTRADWRALAEQQKGVYLFAPQGLRPSGAASRYIRHGEAEGVQEAYKCRVRSPWWRVPQITTPDLFVTYMNSDTPRLVTNGAGVPYLNSVHGLTLREDRREAGRKLLPLGSLNSLTLLGAELVGRAYGGGMLKLEPGEADRLPVPSLSALQAVREPLEAIRPRLESDLRQGDLPTAVRRVDEVLFRDHLDLDPDHLAGLRAARQRLFHRRRSRGRARS